MRKVEIRFLVTEVCSAREKPRLEGAVLGGRQNYNI